MIWAELILFIVLFVAAIIFHEIGHLIIIKRHTKQTPYLEMNKKELVIEYDQENLVSLIQHKKIAASGILLGSVPLIFSLFWLRPEFSLSGVILYFFGCQHDFKEIARET